MSEGLGLDDGTGEPADADPRHDVLAALDAVRSGLEWLREAADRAWALSEEDLRESVAGGYQSLAAYQSTLLALVKVLDERPDAVPGASASRPAAAFLQQRVRLDASRANADVRAAHALDPADGELPEVGAALAAGEITLEHADVCTRVLARLPKRLLVLPVVDEETGDTLAGIQVVDRVLARFTREAQVRTVKQLVDQLVAILDPHRKERFDEDAHLRRSLRFLREDSTGMGLLRVTLTPAHAALLEAAIKAWSKPMPAAEAAYTDESGTVQTTLIRDERTPGQRQYDALWSALLAGFTGDRAGLARMPRVDLSILATLDQLAAAGLDMAALREQVAARTREQVAARTRDQVEVDTRPREHRTAAENQVTENQVTENQVTENQVAENANADNLLVDNDSAASADSAEDEVGDGVVDDRASGKNISDGDRPPTATSTAAAEHASAGRPADDTNRPPSAALPEAFRRNASHHTDTDDADLAADQHSGPIRCGPGLARLSRVGPIGALLLGYLTCNATLTRLLTDDLGHPLDVGRTHRLATDRQRKALAVRDGGCTWPCCTVPFEGTDIHHLHEWQHGGPTDLINLGSFCERHHQMLHMGLGEARIIDGHVHIRLPKWMDPEQRWLRNTAHHALETATRVGQQLTLAIDLARQTTARLDTPAFDPHCWDRDPGADPPRTSETG